MAQCSECREDYPSPYHFARPGVCNACAASQGIEPDPDAVRDWYSNPTTDHSPSRGSPRLTGPHDPAHLVRVAGWLEIAAAVGALLIVVLGFVGMLAALAVARAVAGFVLIQFPLVFIGAAVWYLVFRWGALILRSLSRIEGHLASGLHDAPPQL